MSNCLKLFLITAGLILSMGQRVFAQDLPSLYLQPGDNVTLSGSGTDGTYTGREIDPSRSVYKDVITSGTCTFTLEAGGTIKDALLCGQSVITIQGGEISSDGSGFNAAIVSGGDTLTINGGTISNTSEVDDFTAIDADLSAVKVTNGIITATGKSASAIKFGYLGGSAVVVGGIITAVGEGATAIDAGSSLSSRVEIDDGTVSADGNSATALVVRNYNSVINGGTISATGQHAVAILSTGRLYINGGTIHVTGQGAVGLSADDGFIQLAGTSFTDGLGVPLTGPVTSGSGTIRCTLSDGSNLDTSYSVSNGGEIDLVNVPQWGPRVAVTFNDSTPRVFDRLVMFDRTSITLARDLKIDDDGTVVVDQDTYPINKISRIEFTDQEDQGKRSLYDKYILLQTDPNPRVKYKTVTARLIGFTRGVFEYVRQSISGHTPVETPGGTALEAIAIPRIAGSNSASTVMMRLRSYGASYEIPPHILYGLAWDESYWRQYYPQSSNSDISYLSGTTVVTFDGGIGLFQLTGVTAVFDTNRLWDGQVKDSFPPDTLTHIYALAGDMDFNAASGAYILNDKYQSTLDDHEAIGDGTKIFLEHWLKALNLYNGNNQDHYKRILNAITTDSYGQGIERLALSNPQILEGKPSSTSYPAHADVNSDGVVDLVLQQPSLNSKKDQMFTFSCLAVPQPSIGIKQGDVYITNTQGNIVAHLLNRFPSPQLSPVPIGGSFVLPKGTYTAHISVGLSNGIALGATYQFDV